MLTRSVSLQAIQRDRQRRPADLTEHRIRTSTRTDGRTYTAGQTNTAHVVYAMRRAVKKYRALRDTHTQSRVDGYEFALNRQVRCMYSGRCTEN